MSDDEQRQPPWYRIPVIWVAAFVLLASVIGCFINIGVAWRHADTSMTEVAPGSSFLLPPDKANDDRP